MTKNVEFIELEIVPIPPDTVDSCKAELLSVIKNSLHEVGKGDILSKEHLDIQIEKTFPTDAAVIVALTLLSSIALETYKEIIIPALKNRYKIRERSKRKKK